MYRDRAGAENLLDELKNQWGWTGFSTQDLKRSQLMARIVALVYNWWSIFTRMGTGASHVEAITTRPLFQRPWCGDRGMPTRQSSVSPASMPKHGKQRSYSTESASGCVNLPDLRSSCHRDSGGVKCSPASLLSSGSFPLVRRHKHCARVCQLPDLGSSLRHDSHPT